MPKGMFTQGACVLLEQVPSLDEIAAVLTDFDIRKRMDASSQWAFSGPAFMSRSGSCKTSWSLVH